MSSWRDLARSSAAYPVYRAVRERADVATWRRRGRPVPPPARVKREVLREHARRYGCRTFVETGTYRGDTLAAVAGSFRRAVSIELHPGLHAAAERRFAGNGAIDLLQGDSGVKMREVLDGLTEPALFWLDAHYSAGETARGDSDTPIERELDMILAHPVRRHVVLIDDARDFNGENGYPTLARLRELVQDRRPDLQMALEDDIIRITPA